MLNSLFRPWPIFSLNTPVSVLLGGAIYILILIFMCCLNWKNSPITFYIFLWLSLQTDSCAYVSCKLSRISSIWSLVAKGRCIRRPVLLIPRNRGTQRQRWANSFYVIIVVGDEMLLVSKERRLSSFQLGFYKDWIQFKSSSFANTIPCRITSSQRLVKKQVTLGI